MTDFAHLHVHSQYSLLDGAASIPKLCKKAAADGMKALAITDHGNMFGAFQFVAEAAKHNIKPIVGCEFYLVEDRFKKSFTKDNKDVRFHQLLLAKNAEGYKNLVKLCSLGYMDGLYGKYPRIDKELILKYHKGLIATTCCLAAEVPRTIIKKGEDEAEKVFKWWLDLFGEDYFVELQRHDIKEQHICNEVLIKFARKYNVPIIASNDSHYVDQQDYNAHDILLCINTGEKQSTPSMKEFTDDDAAMKGRRFAFANDQFYFKTTAEMSALFHDLPEAIDNTMLIVDKVEPLKLKQDILLPNFPIPSDFYSQDEFLEHLTYKGAKERYRDLTPEIEERLNFELHTIRTMGFAGYFLIVQDFINKGKEIGVFVGPGRGSAAGSAVAYCIGITNIDPIKYNLLFERFLNPDRKSMPDIDTDFDDEGRQRVIDYVVDKYGKNQVAQIVTYGTMAAKMSIKDVARVLDLPLPDANGLAKLVPEKPGISLDRVLKAPIEGEGGIKDKEGLSGEDLDNLKKLREILDNTALLESKVLKEALILEGSVRGTGIHAAGIIIAPKDLSEIIPVCTSKDSDLLITQYDGRVIEDAGVIKMDFLGLKTLTIIRDALQLIRENHNIDIDIDTIPLDDAKTLALYQRGETNGTFQFESPGMQKYLKDLKPDKFEDLIAMNALYRPGPLEYIPNFIKRKHGLEPVTYDLADMEEFLKDTYGITVYQEQVMLLSQKLADFSKGDADVLRKAMGKKDRKTLDKLKPQFIEGAATKGHDKVILEKIWTDWEAFASYAFNKSHSTCYAFVAFQTGYLKAHYPSEYMASVLTHNLSNFDKITFFMEECVRMGIPVLGPDVNESKYPFSVNASGQIRFGLGAIKGVGEGPVQAIIEARKEGGMFSDFFDFAARVNLKAVSKKTFENLALAGAFDSFSDIHRAQYFHIGERETLNLIEKAIRYGNAFQQEDSANQASLFGNTESSKPSPPKLLPCEPWGDIEKLKKEKEIVGFYISGHPLDQFKLDIDSFCTITLDKVMETRNKDVSVAGIISKVTLRQSKNGKPFALFSVEDYNGSLDLALFGEDYLKFSHFLIVGTFIFMRGMVVNRFGKEEYEFKPTYMQLLADVRSKMCKSVTLQIDLDTITPIAIQEMDDLVQGHPGNCNLYVQLAAKSGQVQVKTFARKYRVDPNNQFITDLAKLEGVSYKINA
ncbi:MAG: DNA polymerase III subunit alpha [Cytophagaceae bacterium]|jgi:DNA polymerase-3 subunit alpha|nr:DNA polymerase III subunit alpha [Cytophagaceae bacterium]